jgi:hypothetical protein
VFFRVVSTHIGGCSQAAADTPYFIRKYFGLEYPRLKKISTQFNSTKKKEEQATDHVAQAKSERAAKEYHRNQTDVGPRPSILASPYFPFLYRHLDEDERKGEKEKADNHADQTSQ